MDFEAALQHDNTIMLTEGPELSQLGAESPIKPGAMPPSPVVVPPMPSKAPQPQPQSATASSSTVDLFGDGHSSERERERNTNRRSMYRAAGTSSSPDLATLLRKAKDKGAHALPKSAEKRRESPPPLPTGNNGTVRQRSSTQISAPRPLDSPKNSPIRRGKQRSYRANDDWLPTNTQQDQAKSNKSTVRSKTSAFLGKLMGQGTVRERSKTDASLPPSSPSFTPPVPPLPTSGSPQQRSPTGSPIADVFTHNRFPDTAKPLPPIALSPNPRTDVTEFDDGSMIVVNHSSRSPSPWISGIPTPSPSSSSFSKRRSMSVGETDLRSIIAASSSSAANPLPLTVETGESTIKKEPRRRLLSDLQGELSSLDPERSPTLDLRDPSTPERSARFTRSNTDDSVPRKIDQRPEIKSFASSPTEMSTPTVALHQPPKEPEERINESPQASPIVPFRSSSLSSPPRSSNRPASLGSPVLSTPTIGRPRANRSSIQGPRDAGRLRVIHRSTASSSEPSLIPNGVEGLPSLNLTAQKNLMSNGSSLTSFPSSSVQSLAKSDDATDPEIQGKEAASRCFNEDEEFLSKERIAEWLGGHGAHNKVALRHYMDFFDFTNLRLDMAFRRLCAKLYLKGETQQVDRILEEFSRRYWECNSDTVYGSANIVHAVSYSLLLLNTDLHVADLATRMSRSQFVRNTLTAIQMQVQPTKHEQFVAESEAGHDDSSSVFRSGSGSDGVIDSGGTITSRTKRSDSVTSWSSQAAREAGAVSPATPSQTTPSHHHNGSTVSFSASATGHGSPHPPVLYGRTWEIDMENLLKEMYNAIKSQQILQPINSSASRPSLSSLSPGTSAMVRNRSLRGQPDRLATLKRGSIRGLQSIIGNQPGVSPYSSNSSIDGRVSPSPSYAASAHELQYGSSSSFLTPTLGFASNLSHTIIRETQEDDDHRSVQSEDSTSTSISITDEELALLGAPWAKEGMLCRKQYWEASGKRAKDKSWLDVFVVIQKGELNMFTFGGEHGAAGRGVFGGGNWLANADSMGTVQLAHSLAHALPPPGYNRQRPYCMVLTLSNGGVYFFQAGTEELVNEWVSTCNYWAARTSKEPLAGGVSNMEYGWNRVSDPVHGRSQSDSESVKDDPFDALSIRSGRSSRSKFGWREGAATVRAPSSPWGGEKLFINDWKPPMPPTVSSVHDEETQMEALQKHVASMKRDLKRHNELREPMNTLYQPRSANALKAQNNWERKSQYLLTEIVKYDSYIDSLQAAMSLRLKKRGEKALELALKRTAPSDEVTPTETNFDDEPAPSGAEQGTVTKSHRRDGADSRISE